SGFKTYTDHYGHIIDRRQKTVVRRQKTEDRSQRIVDEVILTVMRAPRSYTKEDIVEINCHSGIAPLKKILDLALHNGARLAEPGEFTKRAFLNGRIDILQAESVLEVIRAKTDLSLRAAMNNLEGLFSKKINDIRHGLIGVLAHIEACIDFSEEGDMRARRKDILNRVKHLRKDIERLISRADEGKILRQGIKTVICGSPNVGKSSLMNALVKESRAIVTHIPGTTRDTIEEVVNMNGIPVVLVDTAGIIDTTHPIEKEGVRRSHFSLQKADLVLFVLDYGRRINKNDMDIVRNIRDREIIIVVNKIDLKKRIDIDMIKRAFPKRPLVYISAINLSGIDKLEKMIRGIIFKGRVPTADFASVSNDRQLDILLRTIEDVREATDALRKKVSMELVAIYVRSSIETLGMITGHTITEEALDRIFSEFCIGK
ncbi:MAG: tRNA uridine-5-carboxymethylaminomethyl(34) synthesis GTPase MnmE, partial [Candidatus Omnitrophica bacterium]|nr:tRNA uridine-5-carboxymethylaminomethyl(34) synthesis GTPase MnmE [Candidatus Omnitrophota bacterium]